MARSSKAEKQHERIRKVVDDYVLATNYRSDFMLDWERYYRMYRSRLPGEKTGGEDPYPFESQVFVPYMFSIIETQLPLLIQQLFSGDRFFEVTGRTFQDEQMADIPREILNYQFDQDIKIFDLIYLWAKQALLYGTSPVFVDWRYRTINQRIRVPIQTADNVIIADRIIEQQKVTHNGPNAAVIDVFQYFQDPSTPGNPAEDDDVRFAGYEFWATYEELQRDSKDGFYNDNVKSLQKNIDSYIPIPGLEKRLDVLGKQGTKDRGNRRRNLIPCIRYFGKINEGRRGLVYREIVIAFNGSLPTGQTGGEQGTIIRDEENPYFHDRIPICLLRVNLNVGELYGVGDIETGESLQIELNDQRNQRNDNIVRQMDQMWKVKQGRDIDESEFDFRPNGIIEVQDHDDIMPLVPNTGTLANSFVEEGNIKQDLQFSSGVSDFIVGQFQNSTGFNDTATGISLIQGAAENRIVLKGQFLQVGVKCLGELVWQLNQQFLSFGTVFRILDPRAASKYRFVKATPEAIRGQFSFSIVNGAASGNPQIKRQQLMQVMQLLPQVIGAAQQQEQKVNIDYSLLLKRVLEVFQIPNMAEIFPGLLEQQQDVAGIPEDMVTGEGDGQGIDPETENQLILVENAQNIQTNRADDDLVHILSHDSARNSTDTTPSQRMELEKHMALHQEQLSMKKTFFSEEQKGMSDAISAGDSPLTGMPENTIPATAQSSPDGAGGNEAITRQFANSISPA